MFLSNKAKKIHSLSFLIDKHKSTTLNINKKRKEHIQCNASDVEKARQENGKIDILMQMLEILHDQNSVPVAMLFQPNPD